MAERDVNAEGPEKGSDTKSRKRPFGCFAFWCLTPFPNPNKALVISEHQDLVEPHEFSARGRDHFHGQFRVSLLKIDRPHREGLELIARCGCLDLVFDRLLADSNPHTAAGIERATTVGELKLVLSGTLHIQSPCRLLARALPAVDRVPVVAVEGVVDIVRPKSPNSA